MSEDQNLSLRIRQPEDRLTYSILHFAPLDLVFRRRDVVRSGDLPKCRLPESLERLIPDNAKQPGSQRRSFRVVRAVRSQQLEETSLHDVLGVGRRARQPVRESEERRMMLIELFQQIHPHIQYYRQPGKGIGGNGWARLRSRRCHHLESKGIFLRHDAIISKAKTCG